MKERLMEDLKAAMKNQDKTRLAVIRMVKAAIQMDEIAKGRALDEAELGSIFSKQIKTRKESIVEFEKGNRQDLIDQTNEEIKILSSYMPEQLSEEKIIDIIDHIIKTVNATSIKDMGSVMKEASSKLKGKADMSLVSSIIKNKLN